MSIGSAASPSAAAARGQEPPDTCSGRAAPTRTRPAGHLSGRRRGLLVAGAAGGLRAACGASIHPVLTLPATPGW
ncbi:hypothetical protein ACWGJT_26195 [Streptomyces xantholiticus]